MVPTQTRDHYYTHQGNYFVRTLTGRVATRKQKWLFLYVGIQILVTKLKLLRLFLGSLKARAPGLVYLLDSNPPLNILRWLSFLQPAEGSWPLTVTFPGY